MRRRIAALALLATAACGASIDGPGRLRYRNRPPVRLVNDRRPVEKPKFKQPGLVQYYFRVDLARRLPRIEERVAALERGRRAVVPRRGGDRGIRR